MSSASVADVVRAAREAGRGVLLESEGLAIAESLGLRVPRSLFVEGAAQVAGLDLESFPGESVVLKVVSDEILHKSDVGGVTVVAKTRDALSGAIEAMGRRLTGRSVEGFSINERVEHERALGRELLLGVRNTPDFGPVVSLGLGGVFTELLAGGLRPGHGMAILSPEQTAGRRPSALAAGKVWLPIVDGSYRGQERLLSHAQLDDLLGKFLEFAALHVPESIEELEINPVVLTSEGPVALDALGRLGQAFTAPATTAQRPLDKVRNLLEPQSVAIMGVSQQLNPGHIILNNLIREGFDRERIFVVKPGLDSIEGCRCVPGLAELPSPVDLLVLCVGAGQVPEIMEQVLDERAAESLIVIPGGLGERSGSEGLEQRLRERLQQARESSWRGPVVNGGNCLGVRSRPGRYDTMFIPEHKLEPARGPESPLAMVSQSGAYVVAAASKLAALNPRYLVSVGNQTDLTVGDYLTYLADDPQVEVFACYVEGFKPGDGLAFLKAARRIVDQGRSVLLYRAGRTGAGARATASHTASIAGDYAVTRELAEGCGVSVVDCLDDLVDLARLLCLFRRKRPSGLRLGAVSNAGFECVAFADNLGPLELAELSAATVGSLEELLAEARIDEIVAAGNPLDLTPMLGDQAFAAATRILLDDPAVDAGVVGCVPLTGALNTLPAGAGHDEDLEGEGSIVGRLIELAQSSPKPWVAVVDAGSAYDPMVSRLQAGGVPTFRSADRALRLLGRYCAQRLGGAE